jgi:hypothetical protein
VLLLLPLLPLGPLLLLLLLLPPKGWALRLARYLLRPCAKSWGLKGWASNAATTAAAPWVKPTHSEGLETARLGFRSHFCSPHSARYKA